MTVTRIEVASILSARTREGMVEFQLDGVTTQWDLPKACEIVGMIHGAIEAAVTDELLVKFLTTKVGLSDEAAVAALRDFRELRQGSRETVYPN